MRVIRNTAILAKVETTYGTDPTPSGSANAVLISNASFDYSYNNVDRALLRGYMGGSEQLVGTRFVNLSFEVEIAGSGAAGTAPAWGDLLLACGMAEVVTASTCVEYSPVSSEMDSITIYYYDDGVVKKALGCMGTFEMAMGEGERPVFKFSFTGIDGGASAASTPSLTLSSWKAPLVITDTNTAQVTLGGTYSAGVVSGGTTYNSRGLSLNIGNDVQSNAMLGDQSVGITNRDATGSIEMDLTAAQEVSLMSDVNANTVTSMSMLHGTTGGGKILVFAPAVQRINPKQADYNGYRHISMDLRLTPSSGNDELTIVAL
jgi:hypothetical protein